MIKTKLRIVFSTLIAICMCFMLGFAQIAEAKSFNYERMDFIYKVNKDSTVDVSEVITFDFDGQFNMATRDISLKGTDRIDNIEVFEVMETIADQPLRYSNKKLDKLDEDSWGKYAVSGGAGSKHIEWYFNANSERKVFRVNYTIHGAVSFLKDKDELYWNLFTDFEAPIGSIGAIVQLPEKVDAQNLQSTLYYSGAHPSEDITAETLPTSDWVNDFTSFSFGMRNIEIGEDVTIAAGWPKGLVDQKAYFKDLVRTYYPIAIAFIAGLLTLIYLAVIWYRREGGGSGVIIAQYTPPRNLRPAVMEMVLKENISVQGLTATIVDLAVRGYIKIEEDKDIFPGWFSKLMPKDYILTKLKDDNDLSQFEREYMRAMRLDLGPFSTRLQRSSRDRTLVKEIEKAKETAFKDTKSIDDLYTVSLGTEKEAGSGFTAKFVIALSITIFALVILNATRLLPIIWAYLDIKLVIMVAVLLACYVAIVRYSKYEAYLSDAGRKFRDELLGFKLFLSVTGKDRMQNLTPDMFEKYLPYAILFKIEKKWAKNFEGMHIAQPTWYAGPVGSSSYSGGASSFSAAAFSSSLSSSFTSAMGSTGASGGGGSAGGGGGGGGGGAS